MDGFKLKLGKRKYDKPIKDKVIKLFEIDLITQHIDPQTISKESYLFMLEEFNKNYIKIKNLCI